MEPHATTAHWDGDRLTVYDSNQGAIRVHQALVQLFGLDDSGVHVVSEHVGGGFGSKGSTRPHTVLAAMAARMLDRPVRVTLSRQQLFSVVGYRTPTISGSGWAPTPGDGWPPWTTKCSSRLPRSTSSPSRPP